MNNKVHRQGDLDYFDKFLTPFLMFSAILVVILYFTGVITFLPKPAFTIYKEECKNETTYKYSEVFECYPQNTYFDASPGDTINSSGSMTCISRSISNRTDFICESVEVDEINYNHNLDCQHECEKELCNFDCKYNYKIISKKDLTINWLADNCKLIVSIPKNKLYFCGEYKVDVIQ